MKLVKKLLAGTALGLTAVTAAQAAPVIVSEWGYSITSIWTARSPATVDVNVAQDTLTWGTDAGFGRSSLHIDNPAPGSVDTYIGNYTFPPLPAVNYIGAGSSITHNNFPIAPPTLASATLTATLLLTPTTPGGGSLPYPTIPSISYDIAFSETPNVLPCAVVASPTPCNDIFVQLTGLLNQSFTYDFDGPGGEGPQTYYVNVYPVSGGVLSVLTGAACAAAGQPPGCVGFTTPEGLSTTLAFGFTISTERITNGVPEPTSIALIGVALAGLGLAGRRRKSVK